MSMRKTCLFSTTRLATLGLSVVLTPAVTLAVDLQWSQTVGPVLFYDTGTNWTPAQVPTDADNVTFSIDVAGLPIIIGALSNGLNVNVIDNDWTFTGGGGAILYTEGVVTIDDPLVETGAYLECVETNNYGSGNGVSCP